MLAINSNKAERKSEKKRLKNPIKLTRCFLVVSADARNDTKHHQTSSIDGDEAGIPQAADSENN